MPPAQDSLSSIAYIVPTLNEERALGETLKRICQQSGPKEIIIADGGSTDSTLSIAKDYSCKTILSEPGRGIQMNAGASLAVSPLICFIHADTLLPENASKQIRIHLSEPAAVAGSFRLRFNTPGGRLGFYSYCSRINLTLFTYGDQALFTKRETFESIGGYESYPFLEDIEIQRRLRKLGRFVKSKESVVTSSRRFTKKGPTFQQLLNIAIVAAYSFGVSPASLRKLYQHVR